MRKKALLLLAAVVLASCSWPDSSVYYTFNEKSGEVMLTDLYGLVFKPVCSVDGKEKKCGAVFREFMEESMVFTSHMEYSTTEIVIPGFKDASILSLQVKDDNSGDVRPLLSYKQSDSPVHEGEYIRALGHGTACGIGAYGIYAVGLLRWRWMGQSRHDNFHRGHAVCK